MFDKQDEYFCKVHAFVPSLPQVNNYIEKTARVVFGPDLVVLELPHQTFNVLSLSGTIIIQYAIIDLCG